MNKFKITLVSILFVLLITILSCRSLLEEVMPASINKRAVAYAAVDPNDLKPYPTLADAKRVKIEIIVNHRDQQIALKRAAEDDNLYHGDALGFINQDITVGDANLDLVIGSKGNPLSIMGVLFALAGGSGLAVGRKFLRRPGDFTPEEHDRDVEKAKNGNA